MRPVLVWIRNGLLALIGLSIQMGYGLARHGKINTKDVPRNVYHIAVLFELGESYVLGSWPC